MPTLPIPTNANADFYMSGRLVAMRGTRPAAVDPPRDTPAWWANEGTKDWWAGIPSRTGVEPQWAGGGAPSSGGSPPQGQGTGGGVVIRTPVPARPPSPKGVWIPPPGASGVPAITYEIFGRIGRRIVPYTQVVQFRNGRYVVKPGDTLSVGNEPRDGFGYAGKPGRWTEAAGGHTPMQYGLDADKGVVAFNGTSAHPVPSYELLQLFGPNWRMQVYR